MANGEADVLRSDDAASLASRYGRPAAAGLLLLIVIAGIGAASPGVTGRGPWRHDALGLGVGLEVALAGLQVALVIVARRTSASGHPAAALRHMLRRVIAVVMAVVAVIAIVNLEGNTHGDLIQRVIFGGHRPQRREPSRLPTAVRTGTAHDASYVLYGLLGVIVLAAIVGGVIVVWRARTRARRPAGYVDVAAEEAGEDLRQAVAAGRQALRAVDDSRAAIIACYVAMESSLASGGTSRGPAETPDELLTRAVTAGLIRGPAAATLTGLFYEARFSSHPLPAAARDTARQAVEAISAELGDRDGPAPTTQTAGGAADGAADGVAG